MLAPRPRDYVMALVSGFPARERANRLMMILQAICDESVTQAPGVRRGHTPFFVLGGLIGSADGWSALSDEWHAELSEAPPGATALEYFKFSEALGMTKQFHPSRGWTETDRTNKLTAFARIARKHALRAIFLFARVDEYEELVAPRADRMKELKSPYFFCFYQIIDAITSIRAEDYPGAGLDYIFDREEKLFTNAKRWWPRLKAVAPWRHEGDIGSDPIPRDSKTFMHVQAADLYVGLRRAQLEQDTLECFTGLKGVNIEYTRDELVRLAGELAFKNMMARKR